MAGSEKLGMRLMNIASTLGLVSLTGNLVRWNQSACPQIEQITLELLSSINLAFRLAFAGSMFSDEEALAYEIATLSFEKLRHEINTLRNDSVYAIQCNKQYFSS